MKTATIEINGLLSALSSLGIEKQLAKLPGIHKAEVNYVGGSATVAYDETIIDLKTIKHKVHECGYHCAGEQMPKHVCVPEDPPVPPETLAAFRDRGSPALRLEQKLDAARALPGQLAELGLDLDEVSDELERQGVQKFIEPYDRLLAALARRATELAT